MNLALVFDTETTGLPAYKLPSNDPCQPHLVQLAAILVDLDTRETQQSMDVIIRPNGWVIPDEVSAIHGITQDHAEEVGVSECTALMLFMDLFNEVRPRIAHNEPFDARIIRIALKRYIGDYEADVWKNGARECTARLSSKIVALPPTEKMLAKNMCWNKTPTLGEAYEFFTGKALEGAHSAMVDTKACLEVYYGVQDHIEIV